MRYKITHRTTYNYSEPVPVCHNQVLLTPRDDVHQRCRWHSLSIRPKAAFTARRRDNYGNQVHAFSVETSHRKLEVTSSSRVQVKPRTAPEAETSPPWEDVVAAVREQTAPDWLEACQFLFDSTAAHAGDDLAQYATTSFTPKRPIVEAVMDFTSRIKSEFKYDTKATHVGTSTEEAFRLKRGVCQDFAHVQIACLRSLGIPARYVSGYLRTIPPPGKPRLVGADQSHAWVSVYCGEGLWLDVDPTNAVVCSTDHVTIAWGRDYTDVSPIKGTFVGGGAHTLQVSVDVAPLDDAAE